MTTIDKAIIALSAAALEARAKGDASAEKKLVAAMIALAS